MPKTTPITITVRENYGSPGDRWELYPAPGDPTQTMPSPLPGHPHLVIFSHFNEELEIKFRLRSPSGLKFMPDPIAIVQSSDPADCPVGTPPPPLPLGFEVLAIDANSMWFTLKTPDPGTSQVDYVYALRIWDGNNDDPTVYCDPIIKNGGGGPGMVGDTSNPLMAVLLLLAGAGLMLALAYFAGWLR